MFVVVKILISAIIIGIVTEVARRYPTYGGMISALPLATLISLIWLYHQGASTDSLSKFALGVLWGLPATIFLLFIVFISLKHSFSLFVSMAFGIGGWFLFLIAKKFFIGD